MPLVCPWFVTEVLVNVLSGLGFVRSWEPGVGSRLEFQGFRFPVEGSIPRDRFEASILLPKKTPKLILANHVGTCVLHGNSNDRSQMLSLLLIVMLVLVAYAFV